MAAAANMVRADMAMLLLLPDLLHDADQILIDGPVKDDAALAHYLDLAATTLEELELSISSNIEMVESVELASECLISDAPKIFNKIELIVASTRSVVDKNLESARSIPLLMRLTQRLS